MKKLPITVVCLFAVTVTVTLLAGTRPASAQTTCNAAQLAGPCGLAYLTSSTPSRDCCNKLREQQPCYCGYLKDPNLRAYVDSDRARKIAKACGITFPTVANCP